MMTTNSPVRLGWMILLLLPLMACDPQKIISEYFKEKRLNRLAVVRDDVEVGGVILRRKDAALYTDTIFDFTTSPVEVNQTIRVVPFKAVLDDFKGERKMEAGAALKLVESLLPVEFGADFSSTGTATVEIGRSVGQRYKIQDLNAFLQSQPAAALRQYVTQQKAEGNQVYIVWEVWKASNIKIIADRGSEIAPSVKVLSTGPIGKAGFDLKYKKTSLSTLEIEGDHDYVFAVRAALAEPSGTNVRLKPLDIPPVKWVMGADNSTKFSAPLEDDFGPVTLKSVE
jgi:hypothetical protein